MTKRSNLTMVGMLLFVFLLCSVFGYAGGIALKTTIKEMLQNAKQNSEDGTPVKSVTITVQPNEQDLLFDQLHHFAQKNFFAIRITRRLPPSSSYTIDMWREDIHIGGSYYPDSGELGLAFLRNHFEQRPLEPIPLTVFDDVINDLQSFISQVPSAITTEKRRSLIITTDKNWRNEDLLTQMKALAEKHSLKYEFSFSSSDYRCIEAAIYGEGFHITTHDCERDTIEDFNIDFYLDYHKDPTATSEETLNTLFDELKSGLDNTDNVTVGEQP